MSINDAWNKFLTNSNLFIPSKNEDVVFDSAARTTSVNSAGLDSKGINGVRFLLNITAVSGTSPTLDLKVQVWDSLAGMYQDLPEAAFAQQTTAGSAVLTLLPGSTKVVNETVATALGSQYRVVATIGGTTPSFTFSLNADYLK